MIIEACRRRDLGAPARPLTLSDADPKPRFSPEPRLCWPWGHEPCREVTRQSVQVEKPKVFLKFGD